MHPVDKSCGIEGNAAPKGGKAQNHVKNDFCAPGTPQIFTPQDLIDLQKKTTVKGGRGMEPADRSALTKLGEGKLIMMKAFIIEAHHADLGSGESVNCNLSDAEATTASIKTATHALILMRRCERQSPGTRWGLGAVHQLIWAMAAPMRR
jgi:hypothetical protein